MDHGARLQRLRNSLSSHKLDRLLVSHLPNIKYLCGFTGSAAALLVAERSCFLFTDGRYRTQAKDEVKGAKVVIAQKSPLVVAAEWVASHSRTSKSGSSHSQPVGIEAEYLSAAMRDRLASLLKGKSRLCSAPPLIERARMVKDAAEILLIREAVTLGASLFNVLREKLRPGVTEVEVAAALEYKARCVGAEGMAFPTILASGVRSAIVHGRASSARVPDHGFVVCDFGVILAGYCSDRTRTIHVGKPSEEARFLYDSVLEAQQAAINAARPGATAGDVDNAARRVLRKRKLAQYFTHSTGHGLGLEIHEAPRLALGQTQELEAGMVITIEPGAYLPGKWGVRIEDVVVVTSSGCEVLTPTDKELVIV